MSHGGRGPSTGVTTLVVGDDLALRLLEEALVEAIGSKSIPLIVLDPDHHMLAKVSPFIGTWGQTE